MFAKRHRFSFKNGALKYFIQTPFFIVKYDNKAENGLECAVIVGKKVDKRATVRNKIKRNFVALIKEFVVDSRNLRLVVYAKKSVKEDNIETANKDLLETLKKLK